VGDECLWISFSVVVWVEFDIMGEVGFGGCCSHGC